MNSYVPDLFPHNAWESAASCGPNGGNCVEVNLGVRGLAGLRDSKAATGPVLAFADREWGQFLDAARSGRLEHA
jgi:hypothetical protein